MVYGKSGSVLGEGSKDKRRYKKDRSVLGVGTRGKSRERSPSGVA